MFLVSAPNTWSQQNHNRWYPPITHNPAIAYERPTPIPNIKIVDVTDDDDINRQLSNQKVNQETTKNNKKKKRHDELDNI